LNCAGIVVQTQHVYYVLNVFNTAFTASTNTGYAATFVSVCIVFMDAVHCRQLWIEICLKIPIPIRKISFWGFWSLNIIFSHQDPKKALPWPMCVLSH